MTDDVAQYIAERRALLAVIEQGHWDIAWAVRSRNDKERRQLAVIEAAAAAVNAGGLPGSNFDNAMHNLIDALDALANPHEHEWSEWVSGIYESGGARWPEKRRACATCTAVEYD